MLRVIITTCLILFASLSQATSRTSLYQVDMILFAHQQTSSQYDTNTTTMTDDAQHAIQLDSNITSSISPWHLLPANSSQLSREYWTLNRKAGYEVLAHYTWLQPSNSQGAISLPSTNRNGWNIKGTVRVRQSNYYLLDTHLLFSAPGSQNQNGFLFSQKQRLKPGTVYYLDHPQAGMLIKVHKIV